MNLVLASLFGYIVLQLLVAFWFSRRQRSEEDFLLAGRSLGPWMGVFAVFATWFGAETCIGATGQAYQHGLAGVATDPFGYAAGIIAVGLLLAVPLWRRGLVTLADLFRNRYGHGVERLAAIIMIPTSVLWAAAQVRAFGQVLASTSELGIFAAITLAAVVVIAYTAIGGMWANAVTDLIQGIVMVLGIFAIGYVWLQMDGVQKLAELPREQMALGGGRSLLELLEVFAVPVFSALAAQELASRVLSMRSATLARNATVTAGLLYLAVGLVPVAIGLTAAGYIGTDRDHEQVLSLFAQEYLPVPLYILFLGALVSAILSTLSGALLVAAALTAHNLVLPLAPRLGEAARVRANRLAVVGFGVLAYGIALASDSVYGLVQEAASLGSAGILVLILFALWGGRFGTPASAHAALLAGLGVYVGGAHLVELPYPYLSSVAAALLAYVIAAVIPRRAPAPA